MLANRTMLTLASNLFNSSEQEEVKEKREAKQDELDIDLLNADHSTNLYHLLTFSSSSSLSENWCFGGTSSPGYWERDPSLGGRRA